MYLNERINKKHHYENRLNDTKDIVESEKIKQKNKELVWSVSEIQA